jgi:SAM-dependent methyltransferase
VLELASGLGTTALFVADEFGVTIGGIDTSYSYVAAANSRAAQAGHADGVRFYQKKCEPISVADQSFDAVMCQCALPTFEDQALAVSSIARALVPGGRLAMAEVTFDPTREDLDRSPFAGSVSCIAAAKPLAEYVEALEATGLRIILTERHDDALATMFKMIDARLTVMKVRGEPAPRGVAITDLQQKVSLATSAIQDGIIGYSVVVAEKPQP